MERRKQRPKIVVCENNGVKIQVERKLQGLEIKKGNPFPLGVSRAENGLQFAVYAPDCDRIILRIYETGRKRAVYSIALEEENRIGYIFSVVLTGADLEGMEYTFEKKGRGMADPYARKVSGMEKWGYRSKKTEENGIRSVIRLSDTKAEVKADNQGEKEQWEKCWQADRQPRLSYSDVILYQLHVRGFTKHSSSRIEERGTFKGIERKLPYLKELGVTSILLLPAYEFDEQIKEEDLSDITKMHLEKYKDIDTQTEAFAEAIHIDASGKVQKPEEQTDKKLNYWGYSENAWYFAPKSAYAYDKANPEREFKELVAALHKEGMELLMDMHFAENTNPSFIIDCLRFWVLEYHVDGFRINDFVVPSYMAAQDAIIGSVKLLANSWDAGKICGKWDTKKTLAECNDGFMNNVRRFLKGDEGQVPEFLYHIKRNPETAAVINYVAVNNGFTLLDMVSYDRKHNEANGENERDGTDFNFSWNCGAEGRTRRKGVLELRQRQIKNALLMLFLSQGTPMLLAGDEFLDTREGNNNPYCQDNEISWLNWGLEKKNAEQLRFVKELIALRKAHPILHMPRELRGTDYAAVGYPDISFHGTRAWYADDASYNRMAAVLLAGKYAKIACREAGEHYAGQCFEREDDTFYIAYNMHWEKHEFDLPRLDGRGKWQIMIDTGAEKTVGQLLEKSCLLQPRSAVLMKAETAGRSVTEGSLK